MIMIIESVMAYCVTFFLLLLDEPIISNIRNNTSGRPYSSDSIQLFGYEGDNISLSFTVEAHPPVSGNVSFINGSAPLPNITVTGSSVTLSFNNLRRTNSGKYVARVGNAVGYQDLSFTVVAYCKSIGSVVYSILLSWACFQVYRLDIHKTS